ncbi:hypothetical protein FE782_00120 [Paenibacillus antri]|uniref:Uncharacterized protein n=1 Tax=Paenibacillus antri TaxID=2582848 RepID=A0A5R9GNT2_9BACL|nr:CBO0543 family protein [Paenibacillus antri]TLS53805.1 hypothetical protein FE782_00120 [Paenibacillus antri]
MFPIAAGIGIALCAWRWGDWRNWRTYLPTIHYFIIFDLLYNLFTWNHRLWEYPSPPNLLPNHLTMNLFIMFIFYPSFILIYLYRYPEGSSVAARVKYVLSWAALWAVWELCMNALGQCVYRHGWNFGWSAAFLLVMIPMLRLHYKNPLAAYALSIPITVFLLLWFQVPVLQ